MQQFTPYFPGYDNPQQPQQQQPQQQQQQQPQDQQQQQPLNMNGPNLAIYSPAAMQPLSVLAAAQRKEQQQQQQQQQQHQLQHQHQQQQQQQQQHQQQQMVSATMDIGAHGKPKRKQVKNACVNCQKACKKCDIGRPCQRCIKYGLTETCVNSVRKERKKGVKRGPYKKRNKSGGDSGTSSGASTPNMASPMVNANLYAQTTGVRANALPMHYQPFQAQGHYDAYAYANNNPIMPQAYMVPTTMPQMYPTNPSVLSYQAMNMISPQQQLQQHQQQQQQQQQHQQQQQVVNGAYRLQEQIQPNPAANTTTNTNSATSTPVISTASVLSTTNSNEPTTKVDDDDDEGSKLTILSQLCSAVLDRNDTPKEEEVVKTEETHQNTPPPSRPHSRETSHENNNNEAAAINASVPNFGNDSPHTYVNGHLAHRGTAMNNLAYGTPGSSPSDSPIDPLNFNKVNENTSWTQQEQSFQQDHNQ